MISLAALKPQILDARITGYGEPLTIPVLPLSYVQWQNAVIGLTPPSAQMKRLVVDVNKPPVDALDYNDYGYQSALTKYNNELALRRIATALAGGGLAELQELELAEQVELIRDMDAGILNALYRLLEGMALKRQGAWFRPEQRELPLEAGDAGLSGNGLGPKPLAEPS